MSLPRLRFTLRSLMMLVAVVALLLAGIPAGMNLGLSVKEEARARQGVVDQINSWLDQSKSWIESRQLRIARSERQAVHDPRHRRWLEEVTEWNAIAVSCRRDLPVYERLAKYPWLPFPDGRHKRDYLSADALAYINQFQEHRAASIWAASGAAVVVLGILTLVLIALVVGRRVLDALGRSRAKYQQNGAP